MLPACIDQGFESLLPDLISVRVESALAKAYLPIGERPVRIEVRCGSKSERIEVGTDRRRRERYTTIRELPALGRSRTEMARELGISVRTVDRYIRHLRPSGAPAPSVPTPPKRSRVAGWIMSDPDPDPDPDHPSADAALRLKGILDRCPDLVASQPLVHPIVGRTRRRIHQRRESGSDVDEGCSAGGR
jgi:hypothetical protein